METKNPFAEQFVNEMELNDFMMEDVREARAEQAKELARIAALSTYRWGYAAGFLLVCGILLLVSSIELRSWWYLASAAPCFLSHILIDLRKRPT